MKIQLIDITSNANKKLEEVGRTSYKSLDKITDDSSTKFIKMLLERGHLSIFEHAFASFRINDVSRALTHQLVRHRLASYVQESQRYVKQNFNYIIPETINGYEFEYKNLMEQIKTLYNDMVENGVPKEDARYILPNATTTEIVMTANFREWMTIFDLRLSKHAQWEIRQLITTIKDRLVDIYPTIFEKYS